MKRIDTINARENMFGIGKSGFHDNADLPGQDATYVSPEWFNTVQEELCNLLELRGITLNPASKRQLYDLLTTQADLEALADEIETNFIRKNQIADDLTTSDATKVASARTVKELQDNKLEAIDLNVVKDSLSILDYCPIPYPKSTPPTGYLAMMGQAISQATYPILYSLYGATLPDLRGQFLRGLDYGKGIDAGRTVLSLQNDEIKSHTHAVGATFNGSGITSNGGYVHSGSNLQTTATGGAETRPKNIAFLYIVKAG